MRRRRRCYVSMMYFKVGGPATSDNKWIPVFLAYCRKNAAPVDLISTHHYPTDAFGTPGRHNHPSAACAARRDESTGQDSARRTDALMLDGLRTVTSNIFTSRLASAPD